MSETHARSILQSVAAGAISPEEAAVLLDALPAEQRADDAVRPQDAETEVIDEADRTGTEPSEPDQVKTGWIDTEHPDTDRIDTDRVDTDPHDRQQIAPAAGAEDRPDRTASVRTQVSAELRGELIEIVCEPGTDVPAVDGPATADVGGDAGLGFTLRARLGSDAAVMLPSAIDLDLAANGADFSLTGIDGTVSAELNVGNVLIDGLFVDGLSRIKANAGDVQVRLQPGSDVEVISQSPATVHADGLEHTGRGRWTLGDGTAKFEIAGHLGSITVVAV